MTRISKRRGPNYKSTTNYALGQALLKFSEQGPLLDTYFNGVRYVITRSAEGFELRIDNDVPLFFDHISYAYREAFLIAEWDFKVRGIVTEMSKEEAQLIIEAMAGDIAELIKEIDQLSDALNEDQEDFRYVG